MLSKWQKFATSGHTVANFQCFSSLSLSLLYFLAFIYPFSFLLKHCFTQCIRLLLRDHLHGLYQLRFGKRFSHSRCPSVLVPKVLSTHTYWGKFSYKKSFWFVIIFKLHRFEIIYFSFLSKYDLYFCLDNIFEVTPLLFH